MQIVYIMLCKLAMAKPYRHAQHLANEIEAARRERGLTFGRLAALAEVDTAQAWRICNAKFTTLNPGVLRICNAIGVMPEGDGGLVPPAGPGATEAKLAAEAVAAWDRTEAGAQLLTRVLRAFRSRA